MKLPALKTFLTSACLIISICSFSQFEWVQKGQDLSYHYGETSMSSDGNTIAATHELAGAGGQVVVYEWGGASWIQKGSTLNGEASGDRFGTSVNLSSDASTIAVGAVLNDGNGSNTGHVKIFSWDGLDWVQKGLDIDGDSIGEKMGYTVSMSADGNVVAVCAIEYSIPAAFISYAGKVKVYGWNGTSWVQRGANFEGIQTYDLMGSSLSLSSNGNTLAIGSKSYATPGRGTIYTWNGTVWTQKGLAIHGEALYEDAGYSISLSSDGNTVAIGSPEDAAGKVRVFNWSGTQWIQKGLTVYGDYFLDYIGASVSLSSDGNTMVCGAPAYDSTRFVRVYEWIGAQWLQKGMTILEDVLVFDSSVEMDGDGNSIIMSTQSGNVRVFSFCDTALIDPNVAMLTTFYAECEATLVAPTAKANCFYDVIGTPDFSFPISTQGTTTVTWTYDNGNGSTLTQMQDVVITDVTAPVGDLASLPDLTDECSVTSLTAPTATDNCAVFVTVTNNASLPIIAQGTTTVTWTYDDGNGNTSIQIQDVVITDLTAPITPVLFPITIDCNGSFTTPTTTDACAGIITGVTTASLNFVDGGSQTITWIFDDGNGNISVADQTYNFDDSTAPVPDQVTLNDITHDCEIVDLTTPTATDDCGTVAVTHDAILPITNVGTTSVTWTYDDGNGNTIVQTQNVIIYGYSITSSMIDDITLTADQTGVAYQWIDCDNGNQAILGETNQTFVASQNGMYAVIVTDGNCSDTSDCIMINQVGQDEHRFGNEINIFPNPSEGIYKVDLGNIDQAEIKVLTIRGKLVLETSIKQSTLELDLRTYENGVYLLQIASNGQSITQRIIKL
ncbi:MAG: hypothetical protein ACI837_001480 [Crocinitomicaceae bacterium]|jgi:hypothetical protein